MDENKKKIVLGFYRVFKTVVLLKMVLTKTLYIVCTHKNLNNLLVSGQSLTFHGAVVEASARGFARGPCRSAICAAEVVYV